MLIYTPVLSPRFQYIARVLFQDILQVTCKFTDNLDDFLSYSGIKWGYGCDEFPDVLCFPAHTLLFENDVRPQELEKIDWQNYTLFFSVTQNPHFPFDPFAVAFYLISRYEEYLPSERDVHNRFNIKDSIAYQRGFHRIPLVNILAHEIAVIIRKKYPQFRWNFPPFQHIYSCDIDMAFRYKGRGFFRWCGGVGKAIIQRNWKDAQHYINAIVTPNFNDPYDISEKEIEKKRTEGKEIIHFIPTGSLTKYDRNISFSSSHLSKLIQKLLPISTIGLHPSYDSYLNSARIMKEKNRLEKLTKQSITKSRQHYLRLSFPDTYAALLRCGIVEDYSLGWNDEVGFRASTTVPFNFFNLKNNQETALKVHSIVIMDVALYRLTQQKETYERIIDEMKKEVQKWGGEFVILQHNSSFFTFS